MKKILAVFITFTFGILIFGAEAIKLSAPEAFKGLPQTDECIELLKRAFEKNGYRIEVSYLPTIRASIEANNGAFDGVFPISDAGMVNFPNLIAVKEPIVNTKFYAYTIRKSLSGASWEMLKDSKVVVPLGVKIAEDRLKDKMKKGTYYSPLTLEQAIMMLQAGRGEYLILPEFLAQHVLKDESEINRVEPALEIGEGYLLLNKKYAHIAKGLADSIKASKNSK